MEERLENVVRRSEQMGWQLVLPHLASASGGAPGGSLPTGGSSLVTQVVTSAKARAELDIALKFVDWFSNRGEGYEHNMTALDRRLDGMVRSAREASSEPFSPSVRLAA